MIKNVVKSVLNFMKIYHYFQNL